MLTLFFLTKQNAHVCDEDSDDENQADGDLNHIDRGLVNTEIEMLGVKETEVHNRNSKTTFDWSRFEARKNVFLLTHSDGCPRK